jgi:hypothetical protein
VRSKTVYRIVSLLKQMPDTPEPNGFREKSISSFLIFPGITAFFGGNENGSFF